MKANELKRGRLKFSELAIWLVLFVGIIIAFGGLFDGPYVERIVGVVNIF